MMSTMSTSRITGSKTSTGVFRLQGDGSTRPSLVDHGNRTREVVAVEDLGVNGDRLRARREKPRYLDEGLSIMR